MFAKELADILDSVVAQKKTLVQVSALLRDDLATVIRDLAASSRDLSKLADSLRQFPNETMVQFLERITSTDESAKLGQLIDTIRAARDTRRFDSGPILARADKLSAAEARALVGKLVGRPRRTKKDNLRVIRAFLEGQPVGDEDENGVDEVYNRFVQIRADLPRLTIGEIRDRFRPLGSAKKATLQAVAAKLGRKYRGTKKEIADQLLGILEGERRMLDRTELIRSG